MPESPILPPDRPDDAAIVAWVTAASEAGAEAIASALVEQRVAACVAITPIHSVYRWQGQIERAPEWQLTIKTLQSRFSRLQTLVRELHSYEVPEILALPILDGDPAYLDWLSAQIS